MYCTVFCFLPWMVWKKKKMQTCGPLFSLWSHHPQSRWALLLCQMLQLQLWPLFSSLLCTPLSSPFTLFTPSPLTPLTHLYQHTIISNICLFFYCSDLSLVPFFHKLPLTQHKARGRRRSPSQKQALPDTSDTGADNGLRIRPLPRWPRFLALPP